VEQFFSKEKTKNVSMRKLTNTFKMNIFFGEKLRSEFEKSFMWMSARA
jgi:hypothetical protein